MGNFSVNIIYAQFFGVLGVHWGTSFYSKDVVIDIECYDYSGVLLFGQSSSRVFNLILSYSDFFFQGSTEVSSDHKIAISKLGIMHYRFYFKSSNAGIFTAIGRCKITIVTKGSETYTEV